MFDPVRLLWLRSFVMDGRDFLTGAMGVPILKSLAADTLAQGG